MPIASVRRCLAVLVAAAVVLPVAGCTRSDDGAPARSAEASSASSAQSAGSARDPLLDLADTDSPDYSDDSGRTVLHRSGQGAAHFTIPRPAATSIRFYVSCSPDSRFRVTATTWFSGSCSTAFQNSGELPLGPVGRPVTVDLDLPAGVRYWIVGLAVS